jgi:predicted nucleic acid-binding protein
MKEPIIIDTSVWIDFFNGIENTQVHTLIDYLENDDPIFICPTILQEILQGISSNKQYVEIKEYLLCLNILNDDGLETALGAVKIYRTLRKKGISIRKSNDCIIAQYAFKYSLSILHKDRDFDLIINNY